MSQNMGLAFDSIYIGGGTPSILNAKDISTILEIVHQKFKIHPHSEITIEGNPGTLDMEKLRDYKSAGINRINIGVQSFNDSNLTFLGRIHDPDEARLALEQARRAGFGSIGLDLIYGLPDQKENPWIADLQTAIDFHPEHLSCYMLTYEKNTELWKRLKNKSLHPLPDQRVADLFETTVAFLEDNGYTHYEISNFAKTLLENPLAHASRHNQKYWSFAPYLGVGPSAHSYIEPKRYWNVSSVDMYIDLLHQGKSPFEEEEILTVEQMMTETIYLGLRQTKGIDIKTFNEKFNTAFVSHFEEVIRDLTDKEMLFIDERQCGLTRKGMVFLDGIAEMFVDKIQ